MRQLPRWVVVAGVLGLAGFVVFWLVREAGLYPTVFADEHTYSIYSRVAPASRCHVPSYLYLWVFSATNVCGEGFYTCARIGNALFFAGELFLVFRVALTMCRPSLALLVAAVAAVDPSTSLGVYFMPEAMYFFGFWLLIWQVVKVQNGAWLGVSSGVTLGALALVKLHALFLLPATGVLLMAIVWNDQRPNKLRRLTGYLVAVGLGCAFVRVDLGYLLAGPSSLDITGSYGAVAASVGDPTVQKASVPEASFFSLTGQVMALCAMFGLPALVMINLWPRSSNGPLDSRERLHLFSAVAMLTLLVVVAVFTASVAHGSRQDLGHLHQRYYGFLFPAIAMLAAAEIERSRGAVSVAGRALRWVSAAVIGLVAVYGAARGLKAYAPGFADGPDIYGLTRLPGMLLASAIGVAALCLAWVRWPKPAALIGLLWLLLVSIVANTRVNKALEISAKPSPWDSGGRMARLYLGDRIDRLTVMSDYEPGLYRAAFAVDGVLALIRLGPGEPIEVAKLPWNRDWVLLVGEGHALPSGSTVALTGNGFTLFQVHRGQAASR